MNCFGIFPQQISISIGSLPGNIWKIIWEIKDTIKIQRLMKRFQKSSWMTVGFLRWRMKMYLTMMAASCSSIIWIAVVIATKKFVRQTSSLMGVTKYKMFAGICVKIFQESDLRIMEPTSWLIRVLIIGFKNFLSHILLILNFL